MKTLALAAALALAGCYDPGIPDGAFKCDAAHNFLCPTGLSCDPDTGLCVHHLLPPDLGASAINHNFDLSPSPMPSTCDTRVVSGSFSGLTNLGAVNTAADEGPLTLTPDGNHLYFLSGGTLMESDLTSSKTAGAPTAVAFAGGPTPLTGLTITADGKLWVTGGSDNGLYQAHFVDTTHAQEDMEHLPAGKCPIYDPAFLAGDPTKELYVAYELAGCNDPEGRGSYIAVGGVDQQIGSFVAAMSSTGYRAPTLLPSGLTMLLSSVGAGAQLYYAVRPALDSSVQWTGPTPLPLGSIGAGTRDLEAVVSPDCNTIYFASQRAGGKGGLDLWAADVRPPI